MLKYRNIYMLIAFLFVLLISIGYASLNSTLTISGEAYVIPIDGIQISNVELVESNQGYEIDVATHTSDAVTFHPYLTSQSGSVTYEVTITNTTSISYRLQGIEEIYVSNQLLSFRVNGFIDGMVIEKKSTLVLTITISSVSNHQTGVIDLYFDFEEEIDDSILIKQSLAGAKSSTDAYVKTGFFPSSEARIVIDFTLVEPKGESTWLFSSRRAYQNQMFGIAWNTTESLLQFNTVSWNLGRYGYTPGNRYEADISKEGLILDGVNYYDPSDAPWQSIFEFYMFANNEARTVRGHNNGQAIIHSVKIYENGILLLDAIPVELYTGEVVIWNHVTNQALENVGTLIPIY